MRSEVPALEVRTGIGSVATASASRRASREARTTTPMRLRPSSTITASPSPRILRGHDRPVLALAFHPHEARLASVSFDRTVRLWDTVDAGQMLECKVPLGASSALTFGGDGTQLLIGGRVVRMPLEEGFSTTALIERAARV